MSSPDRPTDGLPPRPTGQEYAEALGDVIQHEGGRRPSPQNAGRGSRAGRSAPRAWLILLFFSALALYLWFGSPAWLQPIHPAPPSARQVEAGLRVEVYFQARSITAFAEREGRLPVALAEVGHLPAGMGYERTSPDEYRLWMESGGIRLEYSSHESLDSFLGDARGVILGGR